SAHDPRVRSAAVDANGVAHAERRIDRLRDPHRNAAVEADNDVLAGPALGVLVLHGLASKRSTQRARNGRHRLTGSATDLMAENAARNASDDRSESELVIAF